MSTTAARCLRMVPAAALACCMAAGAQVRGEGAAMPDLERAYWVCIRLDAGHHARDERMDEHTLVRCSAISKELQVRRFGDDFGKLHAWTQANKARMLAREP